ncbi:type II secretion system protein GspH [Exilibacterium tricleocarpae]|uniref:Type II secretion system protein H n=1 Tax=Exilibacterium tricleocarpae TaxID=2591008 RepID=A0A545TZ64_9GAMM|nr:type II secretion system minor pseudopilin GspH [Exilibacterium tricleocarpae]TQV82512.1 type II secretion system protein GspH [Exilibacterium tricleocarpae]
MSGKRAGGFTLIEILVVLVIIGFGVGMVSLAVGDNRSREMHDIAQRLTSQMHLALENATFSGEALGVKWTEPEGEQGWRYTWYAHREDKWEVAEEPLLEVQLPEYVDVLLEVDGQYVSDFTTPRSETDIGVPRPGLGNRRELPEPEPEGEEELIPDLVFFASGEATPFTLELSMRDDSDHNQHIEVDLLGRIVWEEGLRLAEAREELQPDED